MASYVSEYLLAPIIKRIYRNLLRRVLGRFLDRDLDEKQLDLQPLEGKTELRDLELKVDALNALAADLPMRITRGRIRSLRLHIPWRSVLTDPCTATIEGVEVCLAPRSREELALENEHIKSEAFVNTVRKTVTRQDVENAIRQEVFRSLRESEQSQDGRGSVWADPGVVGGGAMGKDYKSSTVGSDERDDKTHASSSRGRWQGRVDVDHEENGLGRGRSYSSSSNTNNASGNTSSSSHNTDHGGYGEGLDDGMQVVAGLVEQVVGRMRFIVKDLLVRVEAEKKSENRLYVVEVRLPSARLTGDEDETQEEDGGEGVKRDGETDTHIPTTLGKKSKQTSSSDHSSSSSSSTTTTPSSTPTASTSSTIKPSSDSPHHSHSSTPRHPPPLYASPSRSPGFELHKTIQFQGFQVLTGELILDDNEEKRRIKRAHLVPSDHTTSTSTATGHSHSSKHLNDYTQRRRNGNNTRHRKSSTRTTSDPSTISSSSTSSLPTSPLSPAPLLGLQTVVLGDMAHGCTVNLSILLPSLHDSVSLPSSGHPDYTQGHTHSHSHPSYHSPLLSSSSSSSSFHTSPLSPHSTSSAPQLTCSIYLHSLVAVLLPRHLACLSYVANEMSRSVSATASLLARKKAECDQIKRAVVQDFKRIEREQTARIQQEVRRKYQDESDKEKLRLIQLGIDQPTSSTSPASVATSLPKRRGSFGGIDPRSGHDVDGRGHHGQRRGKGDGSPVLTSFDGDEALRLDHFSLSLSREASRPYQDGPTAEYDNRGHPYGGHVNTLRHGGGGINSNGGSRSRVDNHSGKTKIPSDAVPYATVKSALLDPFEHEGSCEGVSEAIGTSVLWDVSLRLHHCAVILLERDDCPWDMAWHTRPLVSPISHRHPSLSLRPFSSSLPSSTHSSPNGDVSKSTRDLLNARAELEVGAAIGEGSGICVEAPIPGLVSDMLFLEVGAVKLRSCQTTGTATRLGGSTTTTSSTTSSTSSASDGGRLHTRIELGSLEILELLKLHRVDALLDKKKYKDALVDVDKLKAAAQRTLSQPLTSATTPKGESQLKGKNSSALRNNGSSPNRRGSSVSVNRRAVEAYNALRLGQSLHNIHHDTHPSTLPSTTSSPCSPHRLPMRAYPLLRFGSRSSSDSSLPFHSSPSHGLHSSQDPHWSQDRPSSPNLFSSSSTSSSSSAASRFQTRLAQSRTPDLLFSSIVCIVPDNTTSTDVGKETHPSPMASAGPSFVESDLHVPSTPSHHLLAPVYINGEDQFHHPSGILHRPLPQSRSLSSSSSSHGPLLPYAKHVSSRSVLNLRPIHLLIDAGIADRIDCLITALTNPEAVLRARFNTITSTMGANRDQEKKTNSLSTVPSSSLPTHPSPDSSLPPSSSTSSPPTSSHVSPLSSQFLVCTQKVSLTLLLPSAFLSSGFPLSPVNLLPSSSTSSLSTLSSPSHLSSLHHSSQYVDVRGPQRSSAIQLEARTVYFSLCPRSVLDLANDTGSAIGTVQSQSHYASATSATASDSYSHAKTGSMPLPSAPTSSTFSSPSSASSVTTAPNLARMPFSQAPLPIPSHVLSTFIEQRLRFQSVSVHIVYPLSCVAETAKASITTHGKPPALPTATARQYIIEDMLGTPSVVTPSSITSPSTTFPKHFSPINKGDSLSIPTPVIFVRKCILAVAAATANESMSHQSDKTDSYNTPHPGSQGGKKDGVASNISNILSERARAIGSRYTDNDPHGNEAMPTRHGQQPRSDTGTDMDDLGYWDTLTSSTSWPLITIALPPPPQREYRELVDGASLPSDTSGSMSSTAYSTSDAHSHMEMAIDLLNKLSGNPADDDTFESGGHDVGMSGLEGYEGATNEDGAVDVVDRSRVPSVSLPKHGQTQTDMVKGKASGSRHAPSRHNDNISRGTGQTREQGFQPLYSGLRQFTPQSTQSHPTTHSSTLPTSTASTSSTASSLPNTESSGRHPLTLLLLEQYACLSAQMMVTISLPSCHADLSKLDLDLITDMGMLATECAPGREILGVAGIPEGWDVDSDHELGTLSEIDSYDDISDDVDDVDDDEGDSSEASGGSRGGEDNTEDEQSGVSSREGEGELRDTDDSAATDEDESDDKRPKRGRRHKRSRQKRAPLPTNSSTTTTTTTITDEPLADSEPEDEAVTKGRKIVEAYTSSNSIEEATKIVTSITSSSSSSSSSSTQSVSSSPHDGQGQLPLERESSDTFYDAVEDGDDGHAADHTRDGDHDEHHGEGKADPPKDVVKDVVGEYKAVNEVEGETPNSSQIRDVHPVPSIRNDHGDRNDISGICVAVEPAEHAVASDITTTTTTATVSKAADSDHSTTDKLGTNPVSTPSPPTSQQSSSPPASSSSPDSACVPLSDHVSEASPSSPSDDSLPSETKSIHVKSPSGGHASLDNRNDTPDRPESNELYLGHADSEEEKEFAVKIKDVLESDSPITTSPSPSTLSSSTSTSSSSSSASSSESQELSPDLITSDGKPKDLISEIHISESSEKKEVDKVNPMSEAMKKVAAAIEAEVAKVVAEETARKEKQAQERAAREALVKEVYLAKEMEVKSELDKMKGDVVDGVQDNQAGQRKDQLKGKPKRKRLQLKPGTIFTIRLPSPYSLDPTALLLPSTNKRTTKRESSLDKPTLLPPLDVPASPPLTKALSRFRHYMVLRLHVHSLLLTFHEQPGPWYIEKDSSSDNRSEGIPHEETKVPPTGSTATSSSSTSAPTPTTGSLQGQQPKPSLTPFAVDLPQTLALDVLQLRLFVISRVDSGLSSGKRILTRTGPFLLPNSLSSSSSSSSSAASSSLFSSNSDSPLQSDPSSTLASTLDTQRIREAQELGDIPTPMYVSLHAGDIVLREYRQSLYGLDDTMIHSRTNGTQTNVTDHNDDHDTSSPGLSSLNNGACWEAEEYHGLDTSNDDPYSYSDNEDEHGQVLPLWARHDIQSSPANRSIMSDTSLPEWARYLPHSLQRHVKRLSPAPYSPWSWINLPHAFPSASTSTTSSNFTSYASKPVAIPSVLVLSIPLTTQRLLQTAPSIPTVMRINAFEGATSNRICHPSLYQPISRGISNKTPTSSAHANPSGRHGGGETSTRLPPMHKSPSMNPSSSSSLSTTSTSGLAPDPLLLVDGSKWSSPCLSLYVCLAPRRGVAMASAKRSDHHIFSGDLDSTTRAQTLLSSQQKQSHPQQSQHQPEAHHMNGDGMYEATPTVEPTVILDELSDPASKETRMYIALSSLLWHCDMDSSWFFRLLDVLIPTSGKPPSSTSHLTSPSPYSIPSDPLSMVDLLSNDVVAVKSASAAATSSLLRTMELQCFLSLSHLMSELTRPAMTLLEDEHHQSASSNHTNNDNTSQTPVVLIAAFPPPAIGVSLDLPASSTTSTSDQNISLATTQIPSVDDDDASPSVFSYAASLATQLEDSPSPPLTNHLVNSTYNSGHRGSISIPRSPVPKYLLSNVVRVKAIAKDCAIDYNPLPTRRPAPGNVEDAVTATLSRGLLHVSTLRFGIDVESSLPGITFRISAHDAQCFVLDESKKVHFAPAFPPPLYLNCMHKLPEWALRREQIRERHASRLRMKTIIERKNRTIHAAVGTHSSSPQQSDQTDVPADSHEVSVSPSPLDKGLLPPVPRSLLRLGKKNKFGPGELKKKRSALSTYMSMTAYRQGVDSFARTTTINPQTNNSGPAHLKPATASSLPGAMSTAPSSPSPPSQPPAVSVPASPSTSNPSTNPAPSTPPQRRPQPPPSRALPYPFDAAHHQVLYWSILPHVPRGLFVSSATGPWLSHISEPLPVFLSAHGFARVLGIDKLMLVFANGGEKVSDHDSINSNDPSMTKKTSKTGAGEVMSDKHDHQQMDSSSKNHGSSSPLPQGLTFTRGITYITPTTPAPVNLNIKVGSVEVGLTSDMVSPVTQLVSHIGAALTPATRVPEVTAVIDKEAMRSIASRVDAEDNTTTSTVSTATLSDNTESKENPTDDDVGPSEDLQLATNTTEWRSLLRGSEFDLAPLDGISPTSALRVGGETGVERDNTLAGRRGSSEDTNGSEEKGGMGAGESKVEVIDDVSAIAAVVSPSPLIVARPLSDTSPTTVTLPPLASFSLDHDMVPPNSNAGHGDVLLRQFEESLEKRSLTATKLEGALQRRGQDILDSIGEDGGAIDGQAQFLRVDADSKNRAADSIHRPTRPGMNLEEGFPHIEIIEDYFGDNKADIAQPMVGSSTPGYQTAATSANINSSSSSSSSSSNIIAPRPFPTASSLPAPSGSSGKWWMVTSKLGSAVSSIGGFVSKTASSASTPKVSSPSLREAAYSPLLKPSAPTSTVLDRLPTSEQARTLLPPPPSFTLNPSNSQPSTSITSTSTLPSVVGSMRVDANGVPIPNLDNTSPTSPTSPNRADNATSLELGSRWTDLTPQVIDDYVIPPDPSERTTTTTRLNELAPSSRIFPHSTMTVTVTAELISIRLLSGTAWTRPNASGMFADAIASSSTSAISSSRGSMNRNAALDSTSHASFVGSLGKVALDEPLIHQYRTAPKQRRSSSSSSRHPLIMAHGGSNTYHQGISISSSTSMNPSSSPSGPTTSSPPLAMPPIAQSSYSDIYRVQVTPFDLPPSLHLLLGLGLSGSGQGPYGGNIPAVAAASTVADVSGPATRAVRSNEVKSSNHYPTLDGIGSTTSLSGGHGSSSLTKSGKVGASKIPVDDAIEIRLRGLVLRSDSFGPKDSKASRLALAIHSLEALDHVPTSVYRAMLVKLPDKASSASSSTSKPTMSRTSFLSNSNPTTASATASSLDKQNPRYTSTSQTTVVKPPVFVDTVDMLRFEMVAVRPQPDNPSREELRVRVTMEPVKLHLDYDSVMVLLAFFTNKYDLTVSMATPADLVAKNKPVSSGIHRVSFPLHKENAQETKSFVPSTSSNIRTSTTTNATSHASSSTTSTSSSSTSSPASTPESSPQTRPRGDSTSTFSETDGSEGEAERSTQGIVGVEDEMVVGADVFIQRFELFSLTISVDYAPKRVQLSSLRRDGLKELIHLFPIEGLVIQLPPVLIRNVEGWEHVGARMISQWVPHIMWRIPQYLSSVRPIQPLIRIGEGVRDLVMIPLHSIRSGNKHIAVGIKDGVLSFVNKTTRAVVQASVMVLNVTGGALSSAADLVQPRQSTSGSGGRLPPTTPLGLGRRLPSSTTVTFPDASGRWVSVGSMVGDIEVGRTPPVRREARTIWEGLEYAGAALSDSMFIVSKNIIMMPMKDFRRSGSNTKAAISVMKAVPSTIIRPIVGLTEALSNVLVGVHNALEGDPDVADSVKYKQTAHHSQSKP